jgi:IS1 family transposase
VNPITERLRQHAAELLAVAEVLEQVYAERDEWRARYEALAKQSDDFHTAIG